MLDIFKRKTHTEKEWLTDMLATSVVLIVYRDLRDLNRQFINYKISRKEYNEKYDAVLSKYKETENINAIQQEMLEETNKKDRKIEIDASYIKIREFIEIVRIDKETLDRDHKNLKFKFDENFTADFVDHATGMVGKKKNGVVETSSVFDSMEESRIRAIYASARNKMVQYRLSEKGYSAIANERKESKLSRNIIVRNFFVIIIGYGVLASQIGWYAVIPAVTIFILGLPFRDSRGQIGSLGISINSGFEKCANGALICFLVGIILAIV